MATHRHIPLEKFFRPPTRTEASRPNGFINSDNVIDMYRMVDRFLGEHLAVWQMEHTA
jgi:hypothetical protein